MNIIEIKPLGNGAHRNQESDSIYVVPEGWAIIPEDIEIPDTFPFVNIETKNGFVIAMTPGIVPEPTDPIPTELETLRAEVEQLKSELAQIRGAVE